MNKQIYELAHIIYYQSDVDIDWCDAERIAYALYEKGYRLQEEEDDEQAD